MAEWARRHPAKIAEGTKAILRSKGEHATAEEERSRRQPQRTIELITLNEVFNNIDFTSTNDNRNYFCQMAENMDMKNSNWMYMLRTTQQHQVQLSAIADQKANIIIASNCIIFSLTLARIETAYQFWGIWSLLAMSVFSIITAIIVVAPLSLPTKRPDFQSQNFNPLFFMHFTAYTHDEYQTKMFSIMETPEQVKEAMVRDIYQIGKVLSTRKYPFLKLSSAIFIGGIFLTLILFAVQFYLQLGYKL